MIIRKVIKVLPSAGLPAELPHRFSDLPLMLVLPVRILSLRCSFGTDPRPNFVRRSVSNRPKAELSARGLSLFFRNSGQVRRNAVGGWMQSEAAFPSPSLSRIPARFAGFVSAQPRSVQIGSASTALPLASFLPRPRSTLQWQMWDVERYVKRQRESDEE